MQYKIFTLGTLGLLIAATAYASPEEPSPGGDRRGGHHPRMEEVDTDGDGLVSEAEFLAKARERFARMDSNGDGQISREEHRQGREKMRERFEDRRGGHRGGMGENGDDGHRRQDEGTMP